MYRIETKVDTKSPEYQANYDENKRIVEELRSRMDKARQGGPPEAVARHKSRGKLTVRERLDRFSMTTLRSSNCRRWLPATCTTTLLRLPEW